MSPRSILVLGATGYIGGSLLAPLKRTFPEFKLVATIRAEKHAAAVRAAGADEIVVVAFDELDRLTALAAQHDVVINAADADSVVLVRTLLAGLAVRAKSAAHKPIFIHTSGTGVIFERPDGTFVDSKEYDDTVEADIRDIPPQALHREVDLEVFKADAAGLVAGYIICPPAIYGTGTGPVHRSTAQVSILVRDALHRKRAAHVGPGLNVWDFVHIADVADLYALVLRRALSPAAAADATPYAKFYFVNAARLEWGAVARQVGDELHKRGLVSAPGAVSVEVAVPADFSRVFEIEGGPLLFVASTARTLSKRAEALGWRPTRPPLSETLPGDIDVLLKEAGVA